MTITGLSLFFRSLSSLSTSTIRSAEAREIVTMTNTIEIIIKLIRIWEAYVIRLISWPVVIEPETIMRAPNRDNVRMLAYIVNCINGLLKAKIFSALVKSVDIYWETDLNVSLSCSSRTKDLTTRMP